MEKEVETTATITTNLYYILPGMLFTFFNEAHRSFWKPQEPLKLMAGWGIWSVVFVQKETIYADLLQLLVGKVHEEMRTLESLQFCFPVEKAPLGTHTTSLLQHSSFVAGG